MSAVRIRRKAAAGRLPEAVAFGSCTTVKRAPRVSYESGARSAGCLPRPRATIVLDEEGRPFARLEHVRYERHADHPDEIVVRRGLFRRRHVLPFEAVAAVDGKNETVLLRIKP
jgi:hypothetical protein